MTFTPLGHLARRMAGNDGPTDLRPMLNLLAGADLSEVSPEVAAAVSKHLDDTSRPETERAVRNLTWVALAQTTGATGLLRLGVDHVDPTVRALAWEAEDQGPDATERWLAEPDLHVQVAAVAAGHIDTHTIEDAWLPATEELLRVLSDMAVVRADVSTIPTAVWAGLLRLRDDLFDTPREGVDQLQAAMFQLPDLGAHVLRDPGASVSAVVLACQSPFATDAQIVAGLDRLKTVPATPVLLQEVRSIETRPEREWGFPSASVARTAREQLVSRWKVDLGETGPIMSLMSQASAGHRLIQNANSHTSLLAAVAATATRTAAERDQRADRAFASKHMTLDVYRLLAEHPEQDQRELLEKVGVRVHVRWVWSDIDLLMSHLREFGPGAPLTEMVVSKVPEPHEPDWVAFENAIADGQHTLPAHAWGYDLPWTHRVDDLARLVPVDVVIAGPLPSPPLATAVLAVLAPVLADVRGLDTLKACSGGETTVGELVDAFFAATS